MWACDEKHSLAAELEMINGRQAWVHYPERVKADAKAVEGGDCTLVSDTGGRQIWACEEWMGSNCEQEYINGELVYACYLDVKE